MVQRKTIIKEPKASDAEPLTQTQQIEFMIKNWGKMSVNEISEALSVPPFTVSQWATRCRKIGIKLPNKGHTGRPRNINWDYLVKKHVKKTKEGKG